MSWLPYANALGIVANTIYLVFHCLWEKRRWRRLKI